MPRLSPIGAPPRRRPRRATAGLRHVASVAFLVAAATASTLIVADIVGSNVPTTPVTLAPSERSLIDVSFEACGGSPAACASAVRRDVRAVSVPVHDVPVSPPPVVPAPTVTAAPSPAPAPSAPATPRDDVTKRSAER